MSPVIGRKSYISFILAAALWAASMRMAYASEIGQIITGTIKLVGSVLKLVWLIAILVFGWGIVRFIAAADNQEELKKAKGILWWGIIGIFVLSSIIGIVFFLQRGIFGGKGAQGIIKAPQF